MSLNRMPIAVVMAATATMLGAAATAASAATAPSAHPVSSATSPISCSASSVWLKLWGSTGESCYTGSGAEAVFLPGVYQGQVAGTHVACLFSSGHDSCVAGPATFRISPPISVNEITLR
jgi:hypothetical protein